MTESVLDRLQAVHPDLEIWWDSSPLVFKSWVKKMVDAAPDSQKAVMEEQLSRIFVVDDPAKSMIRGCTTNPPLSLTAVKSDPATWDPWIDNLIKTHPGLSQHDYFWLTYKEVIRRGAELMLPIWEATNGKWGYISGQLDPRLITEEERMINDAQEIRAIAPNLMIKVPGSSQGVNVVRALTSMAIPTNVTTCFSLPQIWAVAKAAKEGTEIAAKNKVDLSKWRAVITMMMGRLIETPDLVEQAEKRGIKLSWEERHWIGIYTFRRAYKLLKRTGMPSKMLVCSLRDGPYVNGKYHFWDVEKIAGDIVYTMPPYALEPLFLKCPDMNFKFDIESEDVPEEVLYKMSQIPYTIQSCDENGMEEWQFNTHPATILTANSFSQASIGLEEYVGNRMKVVAGDGKVPA
jgi:transaldolase